MRLILPLGLVLPLLAGCSLSPTAPLTSDPPTPEAGVAITGTVHGGQAAIVGQHIYLFAANTTGNGGNGIAASTSNASISLLNGTSVAANNGVQNVGWGEDASNNYYVITDANGNFALTGDYTCTTGQQVYLYGVGGDTGSGANSAAGLLAVLGACPGSTFSSGLFVNMNEVSTIAAAYAMAGWATDATHVSSDAGVGGNAYASLATTGIANAFANAANLETLNTGVALATIPNGTVPQTTINTLANILAACVNTAGPGSSGCNTLLTNATSNGVPVGSAGTGIEATDTATAALYIAQNPGTNVTALYGLSTPSPPFGTALTAQPNDFTIGISYTGGGLSSPFGIAIDVSGNAWITNYGAGVTEYFSTGSLLLSDYTANGIASPAGIAIALDGSVYVGNNSGNSLTWFSGSHGTINITDNNNLRAPSAIAADGQYNVWVGLYGDSLLTEFFGDMVSINCLGNNTCATLGGFGNGDLSSPQGVAIDGGDNVWVASTGSSSITEFNNEGGIILGYIIGGGLNGPQGVAIDSTGNIWVANTSGSSITELNQSGGFILSGVTGGGLKGPAYIAIDGAGNAWISNRGSTSVSEFSNSGVAITGSNGYTGGGINTPNGIAVDASGNVWITNIGNNTITELIGAAAPVVTPIVMGLGAGNNANGSSFLGTRP